MVCRLDHTGVVQGHTGFIKPGLLSVKDVPRPETTVRDKPMITSPVLASKGHIIHRLCLKTVWVEKRLG